MKTAEKKTMVIGASTNPARYSYLAINKLLSQNHAVVALGNKPGTISGVEVHTNPVQVEDIDTVTLYLNPERQKEYYNFILELHPKRIIFNPGTENDELAEMARKQGIKTMEACTLVLLGTGQY